MERVKDITGLRFGALVVLHQDHEKHVSGRVQWICQCDCGKIKSIIGNNFKRKDKFGTKSCGCRINMAIKLQNKNIRLYRIWNSMIQRCENPKNDSYHNYGGRGIKVHPTWHDYRIFEKDVIKGYANTLTIDRIENDGNYEPGNTQWLSRREQCRKTRRIKLNYDSVAKIRESNDDALTLAKFFGVSRCTIYGIKNGTLWK